MSSGSSTSRAESILIPHTFQHFLFDPAVEPAVTAAPGEVVIFETLDACCGEVRTVEQFMAWRDSTRQSNPLTGPVFVEGAKPGDTLVVEILHVELDQQGFQLVGPERAIIRGEVPEWICHAFSVEGNEVVFPTGIRVQADPVIGCFGNAPPAEPTNHPNPFGGNLDVPAARVGSRLHIPVGVNGALFSLGDVHACQGDGEVVGAPEIGAKVKVRLSIRKDRAIDFCQIEDSQRWHMPAAAETEAEAGRLAVLRNARFIADTCELQFEDALILLTLIGALSMSRTGKWGDYQPVVTSSFSKTQLQHACARYRGRRPDGDAFRPLGQA